MEFSSFKQQLLILGHLVLLDLSKKTHCEQMFCLFSYVRQPDEWPVIRSRGWDHNSFHSNTVESILDAVCGLTRIYPIIFKSEYQLFRKQ